MTREMKGCKQWLAAIWFFGAAIVSVIVVVQCALGRYGDKANEAIGWLLPTILPTLSLIIAVFAAEALVGGKKRPRVESFMFWLTLGVSVFYLGLVSATLFLSPFAPIAPL